MKRPPKVRIVKAKNRGLQIRYKNPQTGKEVRIGAGTHDMEVAKEVKKEIEAKLQLGIDAAPAARREGGPKMSWESFREQFDQLKIFRTENARYSMEYKLDVIEEIAKPKTLGQMAEPRRLAELQARLRAGEPMRKVGGKMQLRPRSPHSVKSYMGHLIAALNWAHKPMGWLPGPVQFTMLDVDRKTNKGRSLTTEEFERMLTACESVCKHDAESWKHLLRGLWETGLRLSEALCMTWDDQKTIRPEWPRRGRPVLVIPAAMQKSRKDETIPMLPAFEAMLRKIPEGERSGFVFNPSPRRGSRRLTTEQAGRIITTIGRKACVSVNGDGKPASAHDLRRSFGQRLADAGVPPRDLQIIMRHASMSTTEAYYLTTRVQDVADRIAAYLDRTHFSMGTLSTLNTTEETADACRNSNDGN